MNDKQKNTIEKLYAEMYYALSSYAYSILCDRNLSEEAVQDTFRIACAKTKDLLASPNPKGWLFDTLKNVINNMVRSRVRLLNMTMSYGDFIEKTVAQDTDTANIDILYSNHSETEEYKLIKKLALVNSTILEVAQELGISVEACKKRIQRARKKLKKYFEKNQF